MKRPLLSWVAALLLLLGLAPVQADEATSGFDRLWSYATLYENAENPLVQKFALSGRLQADGVNFQADQGDYDDVRWRRFRFGFTTAVLEDFSVRIEADFDLNDDGEYQRLTDSYISWSPSGNWKLTALKHSVGFTLDTTNIRCRYPGPGAGGFPGERVGARVLGLAHRSFRGAGLLWPE